METGLVAGREAIGRDREDQAVRRYEEQWRVGRPDLGAHWLEAGRGGSISLLVALVKSELRCRYERGERPSAAEYLERFPDLRSHDDRVLSLAYEEYCLREERDEAPDTKEFCAGYGPWKDSLESQLKYHRALSRVGGPPPPWFPEEGDRFQHFRICKELGRGGAARVYLARDESLGDREVALKVSHDRGSEPSILARLEHEHIVPVHSVVHQVRGGAKLRGLCMPYRPGLPLDQVIARISSEARAGRAGALCRALRVEGAPEDVTGGSGWSTFPRRGTFADAIAWIVAVIADALAYAHTQKIFHRDVKPANILLTYRDGPQLLDFNLSHDPHSADQAEAALRGGTLPYMAPEQLEAFLDAARWGSVAERADLYSLGLLLRELLTGQAPETPDAVLPLPRTISALLDRRAGYRIDIRQLNPRVPHALEAIAGRCLAFSPADRYGSASELAADLRLFLARRPTKIARNPSTSERSLNWLARKRTPLFVSALATVVLAASLGFTVVRGSKIESRTEFIEALAKLDETPSEMLRILDREKAGALADSPVAAFYAAVARWKVNGVQKAAAAFERVWARQDAAKILTEWGRRQPDFSRHALELEKAMYVGRLGVEPARRKIHLECVVRTLQVVLQLTPESREARLRLAVVEEARHNFSAAHNILTALVESLKDPKPSSGRFKEWMPANVTLARVTTAWGHELQKAGATADADAHLGEALHTLDLVDSLMPTEQAELAFDSSSIRCEALLYQGDVAGASRPLDAKRYYDESQKVLDALGKDHPPSMNRTYKTLLTQVKKHLHDALPQLAAPQEETGSQLGAQARKETYTPLERRED